VPKPQKKRISRKKEKRDKMAFPNQSARGAKRDDSELGGLKKVKEKAYTP